MAKKPQTGKSGTDTGVTHTAKLRCISTNAAAAVTSIGEIKGRDTLNVLREATERVEQGEFVGMIFILDTGRGNTRVGATGSYRKNPTAGIEASQHIAKVLMLQKHREAGGVGAPDEDMIAKTPEEIKWLAAFRMLTPKDKRFLFKCALDFASEPVCPREENKPRLRLITGREVPS